MNAKPATTTANRAATSDDWFGANDSLVFAHAPFPSGLLLTAWRGASKPVFTSEPSARQEPIAPTLAHAAFAGIVALVSILLVVFGR